MCRPVPLPILAALLVAFASASARAAAEEVPGGPLVLKVATEAANPPFAEPGPDGHPRGFEIDLASAVCVRLGRGCRFVAREYERLVPLLLAGQVDLLASSLVPSDERRRRMSFSRAYYHPQAVLVGRRDGPEPELGPASPLAGRTLGVERGGPLATAAEDAFPDAEVRLLGSGVEANLDVAAGRLDFALGDRLAVARWLKDAPEAGDCRMAGRVQLRQGPLAQGFAFALRPRDVLLRAKVDEALAAMMADGTYAALARPYFDFDPR